MAIFRKIRNALFNNEYFGIESDPDSYGRGNETSSMLGKKLSNPTLSTSNNDLLEADPLSFEHFQYPEDLNTRANGHYIKFDIYQNVLSTLAKAPQPNQPFDLSLNKIGFTEVGNALARNESKTEKKESHVADNKEDSGSKEISGFDTTTQKVLKQIQSDGDINKIRTALKNKTAVERNEILDKHSHTHNHESSAAIMLYVPSTNKFTTDATYENAETGFLSDFLGGSNIVDSIIGGSTAALTKLTGAAITTALEVLVPGAGGFFNRSTGMATNPNLEIAFKSVPFRSFQFDYKFAPKNKKELDQVHNIIRLFRFHMSPALIGATQYFASPSQFDITYMYRENENMFIPRISKCVLENIEVDYSPGEKFTTLKKTGGGASPQIITMNMRFKEMSIITKETIAENY